MALGRTAWSPAPTVDDDRSDETILIQASEPVTLAVDEESSRVEKPQSDGVWPKRLGFVGVSFLLAGVAGVAVSQLRVVSQHVLADERGLLHSRCHTAVAGEMCYRDVHFAMTKHIVDHPDWYIGLSPKSSFEEFQDYLHHQKLEDGKRRCPLPCGLEAAKAKAREAMGFNKKCHTSVGGEPCHSHVEYTMKQIPQNPEWYPGLDEHSSFKVVQHYLWKEVNPRGHRVCPKPCGLTMKDDGGDDVADEDECHNAVGGETCYTHVKETMKLIQKNIDAHPDWYPGLTKRSDFKEVQLFMHSERDPDTGKRVCPRPCLHGHEEEKASNHTKEEHCHTAKVGESCWNDIRFAMAHVKSHPEWYRGLNEHSDPDEFQVLLHGGKVDSEGKKCPLPCNEKIVKKVQANCRKLGCHESQDDTCHTATKGTPCYYAVIWAATKGKKYYPELGLESSFEEVQNRLHMNINTKCPRKSCPCHTAQPGEACYKTVKWVKRFWVKVHPEWYGHKLSTHSSFEAIQERLHYKPHDHRTHCALPCAPRAWPRHNDTKHGDKDSPMSI